MPEVTKNDVEKTMRIKEISGEERRRARELVSPLPVYFLGSNVCLGPLIK